MKSSSLTYAKLRIDINISPLIRNITDETNNLVRCNKSSEISFIIEEVLNSNLWSALWQLEFGYDVIKPVNFPGTKIKKTYLVRKSIIA